MNGNATMMLERQVASESCLMFDAAPRDAAPGVRDVLDDALVQGAELGRRGALALLEERTRRSTALRTQTG